MKPDLQPASVMAVIVTYNGAPWIEECLASLVGQPGLRHVIVVDNASSDDTVARIRHGFPKVELVPCHRNLGFGRGNNIGIARALQAGARHIYLVNQDAWTPSGSLAALADFLDAEPTYGVASALHCSPNEATVDRKTLSNYLTLHARDYLADVIDGRLRSHYRIHGVNAAAWMVKAETFQHVGGFDPLFFMYGEDDDWLIRAAHHGIGFALLPRVRVVHVRQSPEPPMPPDASVLRERAIAWATTRLLLQAKQPGFGRWSVAKALFLRGGLDPLVDFMFDHDANGLRSRWAACARLACLWGEVARHARTTAQSGRHFLS